MKVFGKIFLCISGIVYLVTGIISMIALVTAMVTGGLAGSSLWSWIYSLIVVLFTIFAGVAGISCLFVATPFRVQRVVGYAIVILVLTLVQLALTIAVAARSESFGTVMAEGWAYIVDSGISILYMVGALLLRNSYR